MEKYEIIGLLHNSKFRNSYELINCDLDFSSVRDFRRRKCTANFRMKNS
jgi:hypothetical protein